MRGTSWDQSYGQAYNATIRKPADGEKAVYRAPATFIGHYPHGLRHGRRQSLLEEAMPQSVSLIVLRVVVLRLHH